MQFTGWENSKVVKRKLMMQESINKFFSNPVLQQAMYSTLQKMGPCEIKLKFNLDTPHP